uniref:Cell division protein FtsL n=1 Tax=candidate division CPR3 bacterium TaxID=2268181 RepID=A0A7C5USS9_UNCC3
MYESNVTNWKKIIKISILTALFVLITSLVVEVVVMSRYSTAGYEIERLQRRKAQLLEENSQLRSMIIEYQTIDRYKKWAYGSSMRPARKFKYLDIKGDETFANK